MAFNSTTLNKIVILLVTLFLVSCGSSRKKVYATNPKPVSQRQASINNAPQKKTNSIPKKRTTDEKVRDYVQEYSAMAQMEMKKFKIPASITLAQGILESGMGESRLARKANNHFGIKCHKGWRGKRIYHDDDKRNECFRVYKDPIKSYRDHSLFLANRQRYAFLFDINTKNYKAWAKGLKKAGYATDPNYPKKLIGLIERYNLTSYDRRNNIKNKLETKVVTKAIEHQVKKGDTLYSISKHYNVSMDKIISKNTIDGNTIYLGQILIIPNSQ